MVPLLPPLTDKTIEFYLKFYVGALGLIILFGGLLAPTLEVKLGLGGVYADLLPNGCCDSLHLWALHVSAMLMYVLHTCIHETLFEQLQTAMVWLLACTLQPHKLDWHIYCLAGIWNEIFACSAYPYSTLLI